mmetsp:Transcript_19359/g.21633  ORF Transcript_19359/g.21633 Transcript_19359/m.21633 type:complete len:337 (-) Transcript_19359:69-1079(-)
MSSISLVTGNTCPTGYTYISSWAACRAALSTYSSQGGTTIFGSEFVDTENSQDWPKGCYYCDNVNGCTDGVWYNHHNTGSANGGAQVFCGKDDDFEPTVQDQILFIGDSDVDEWTGVENNDDFGDESITKFNVGIGGYTCKDVKDEVQPFLDVFDPSKVVLVCGENDLDERSVANTFKLFQQVVQSYIDGGVETVYAFSTKPEPRTKSLHKKYRKLDALIVDWIKTDDEIDGHFVFIDSYKGFKDLDNPNSLYQSDKLHLSETGYGYWETWLATAMEEDACSIWRSGQCVDDDDDCVDDLDWRYKGNQNKNCAWVAKRPGKLCNKTGAQENCGCTC